MKCKLVKLYQTSAVNEINYNVWRKCIVLVLVSVFDISKYSNQSTHTFISLRKSGSNGQVRQSDIFLFESTFINCLAPFFAFAENELAECERDQSVMKAGLGTNHTIYKNQWWKKYLIFLSKSADTGKLK